MEKTLYYCSALLKIALKKRLSSRLFPNLLGINIVRLVSQPIQLSGKATAKTSRSGLGLIEKNCSFSCEYPLFNPARCQPIALRQTMSKSFYGLGLTRPYCPISISLRLEGVFIDDGT